MNEEIELIIENEANVVLPEVIAAENERKEAENKRVQQENNRQTAETTRIANETAREQERSEYETKYNNFVNTYNNKPFYFNNVADMKASTKLKNGDCVITLGYYSVNDGGASTYKIRTKTSSDVEDNGSIHFIGTTLVAEMIIENDTVNVKQFGAKGDNSTDDTTYIQNALNKYNNILMPEGKYKVTSTITVPLNTILKGCSRDKTVINSLVNKDYTFKYGTVYDYNGYKGIVSDLAITSDNSIENKPFGFYLFSSLQLKNISFLKISKVIDRVSNYIDCLTLDNIYIGYCVPNDDYIIKLNGNCDGLKINQLKVSAYGNDTTDKNGMIISECHGGSIKNSIINFNMTFTYCNSISIENTHIEHALENENCIYINDTIITLINCFKFKNVTNNDIVITNANYDKITSLELSNVVFYTKGDMYNNSNSLCEEFNEIPSNAILNINGAYRQFNFADKRRTTNYINGIKIKNLPIFNTKSYSLSLNSSIYKKHILDGNVDINEKISSASLGAINKTDIVKWKGANISSLHYRGILVADEDRKLMYGYSNDTSLSDITYDDKAPIVALNSDFTGNLVVYSGLELNKYTKKCNVETIGRGLLIDNGISLNGNTWEEITETAAYSGVYNVAISRYIKKGNNVEVTMTSTPTKGTWLKGDRVINENIASENVKSWIYDGENWISEGTY